MSKRIFLPILSILCVFLLLCSCTNTEAPNSLSISEGFTNPIGFYDSNPTFSWKLPNDGSVKFQSAYRIAAASDPSFLPNNADLWDSGKQESEQSVWIKYDGKDLKSKQKVFWQVQFWDENGKTSEWSELAHFELGLLTNKDWQANWINLAPQAERDTTKEGYYIYRPQYLRKDFTLNKKVKHARLYITSKGVFEAQINGQKVGTDVMPPGWTPYNKRIESLTYDVTDQLDKGKNVIGIILGEGWYSGRIGFNRKSWMNKPLPQAICQLEIIFENGKKETIYSNETWKGSRNGPIRFSGIYDGEIYDANLELTNWSSAEFDDSEWSVVSSEEVGSEYTLLPKRHFTVKTKIELPTLVISNPTPGKVVFDLGQNMVGVPRINISVKKDQEVTVRFAEMLKKDGTMYTENYRSAKSTDYYIPNSDGTISWEPKFTFHGFRYVELSGFDDSKVAEKGWVTGLVQYSDFTKTGTFSSSHDKLNKLQSNINWGLRGNFFDIPTDCPQRDERLGWTGDAQVFAPTSIFNCDVYAFWASWLQSMREDQAEDGSIPFVVPNILGKTFSTGWADAATVIPWEIYFRTGDVNVLEENYEMMRKLVGYYQANAKNYIADINTFGDWVQPFPLIEGNTRGDTPKDLIGTAYYARSVELTLKAAEVLGFEKDAVELKSLHESVCKAFETKFIADDGKLSTEIETQTGYLLALGFDLLSKEKQQKALPHLLRKIEDVDTHLRTGFLGTPLLAPVLDKFDHTDVMFEMLFKETYPSWFYSINQGATTMWERWNSYSHEDGFGNSGMNSFNHYAYGAIGQWMYERIAGLSALEPGYKKILIAPIPGGPLNSAKAEYNSIYGKISSGWKKVDNGLELVVTIPPNTKAKIVIPMNEGMELELRGKEFVSNDCVKETRQDKDYITLEAIPGTYSFKTQRKNAN